MSLSRKNKIGSVAELLTGRFAKKRLEKARGQKPTKLLLDQLEERQLLSLTVGTTDNILVNDGWQDVRGEIAVDSNNAGDMIVAWTGADRLANPDYDPTNPESSPYLLDENGDYVEDLNIYGRYLTDEVQIITLPQEIVPGSTLADGTKVESGTFELVYNAYETQRFSIYKSSFAQKSVEDVYTTSNSVSSFNLGFYAEGELTWILFKYDSALLPSDNAANLQEAIRAIPGGEYTQTVVSAVSETDFDITFYGGDGVDFAGQNISDIKVRNDFYSDLNGVLEKVKTTGFDANDLRSCTSFQKLILRDVFGDNYLKTVESMMKTQGKKAVVNALQKELDAQADELASGVVTTVDQVQNITTYSSKTGAALGITVSADPWTTAKNIQNAFNAVKGSTLYAPVTRGYYYDEATHTYTYAENPSRAYSSDQSYGTMQAAIKAVEVKVVPVAGSTNQFQVTFTGANGLQNEEALIVSSAEYVTKTKETDPVTGKSKVVYNYVDVIAQDSRTGEYGHVSDKTYSPVATTVKESSSIFRVNSSEVADFVVDTDGDVVYDREGTLAMNGTGRTNQMKPDVAMSADGSFVVVWESETDDATQPYNGSDIMARRFVVQGYAEEGSEQYDKLSFYNNGAENGFVGYLPPETAYSSEPVADPYVLDTNATKVQCVAPVANEFIVNASTNGRQTDPTIGADKDGAFIVAWTTEAQDASYFGGIYARQFNTMAQPVTGDITLASSQIGTNYYGPADAAMSDDGFAVVAWNHDVSWKLESSSVGETALYYSVLEPQSAKFVVDHELVAEGGYGASVSFAYSLLDEKTGDYSARFGLAYTVQAGGGATGDDANSNAVWNGAFSELPTTNYNSAVYEITGNFLEEKEAAEDNANDNNNNDAATDDANVSDEVIHVGSRETSSFTVAQVASNEAAEGDATWRDNQGNPAIGLDADGDVFIASQGFGFVDVQSYNYLYASLSDIYDGYKADAEGLAIRLAWSDFDKANLVYENKAIHYGDKIAYEDKNEDLAKFVKLALGWGYDVDGELVEAGGEQVYFVKAVDCIDVDTYERRFLSIAQKEGATDEQITRLHAVLETLLSPLRNNGNDINLEVSAQEYYTDGMRFDYGAVVSNLRDGSNACFYLAFPNSYVASATTSLVIGRQDNAQNTEPLNAETIAIDLSGQYDNGHIADPIAAARAVQDALNASALAAGAETAFIARYVPISELEFYKGALGEINVNTEAFEYSATVTINDVEQQVRRSVDDYFVLQIVAQNVLHDTPLYIGYEDVQTPTTVTLLDQTDEDRNFGFASSLYVERNGSLGTAQTNPAIAVTSNGDVTVAWGVRSGSDPRNAYNTYPNVGNPIDAAFTHIYVRPFVESTDNAGPTVVNVSLPNGDKVQENETVTSALRDVVVSFSEEMLTMGDGTNYYNKLHAVDNVANWTLLRDGVEVTGAIESITFGMNASQTLAQNTVDENGAPVAEINDGSLAYGTNRWEAVITFAEGYELNDGNYSLVCSSMVQDIARNAIYSQGYAVDGSGAGFDGRAWTLDFSVTRLHKALGFEYGDTFERDNYIPEDYVEYDPNADTHQHDVYGPIVYNDYSSLKQVTRSNILNETDDYGPNTAQAVASNANGDFVTTWVETLEQIDEETGTKTVTQTVWAKAYRALYIVNAAGVREQVVDQSQENVVVKVYEATAVYEATTNKKGETVYELQTATSNGEAVETFADPRQASVAIDDRGDFVVVWDMICDSEELKPSRDVYVAKYAFNGGQMKLNGKAEMMRANVETENDQQYAAVAMDADGDVVVVWESYGQDGSGWGIFGRRIMANGYSYGYTNTIQTLDFNNDIEIEGDELKLTLEHNDQLYEVQVELSVEMRANAQRIQDALLGTGLFTEKDIKVEVGNSSKITIEFMGAYAASYVNLMEAEWYRGGERRADLSCHVDMDNLGAVGKEFDVTETTENNQRFASIAMERDGAFVVTWTSWGQDADAPTESNIYGRKFESNHILGSVAEDGLTATDGGQRTDSASVNAKSITSDDCGIDAYEVFPGSVYDSVCAITVGDGAGTGNNNNNNNSNNNNNDNNANSGLVGTGALLTTRMHVLTAAHVVYGMDPTEDEIYVTFETVEGTVRIQVAQVYIHESFDGEVDGEGADLAVLLLKTPAPSTLKGYELYTETNEVGQKITFAGYGKYGNAGDDEEEIADRQDGVKHKGYNKYELDGHLFKSVNKNVNVLVYDFDDGTDGNDYLGNRYGIKDTGLVEEHDGKYHVIDSMTTTGDSGAPSFINGRIAGICSWGSDYDNDDLYGPGDFNVDVRVSSYVDWINSVIMGGASSEFLVNMDPVQADDDDSGNNNNNAADNETETVGEDVWTRGNQIWSSVAIDDKGNFVVTWTGYNQDGHGDSLTGASNKGLGGVYGRVFASDKDAAAWYGGEVFQVNEYTAFDQVHSQVAMASNGDFVVVYESYQDPADGDNSDYADNYGIYARRYELVEGELKVAIDNSNQNNGNDNNNNSGNNSNDNNDGEQIEIVEMIEKPVGSEFRVTRDDYYLRDKDQLGGSVAVDANGDMVFVWTDLSETRENVDAVVRMRSLTLPEDETPPYVVRANASYQDNGENKQTSLYNNNVTFATSYAPTALVYSFSEYMYSAQMNIAVRNDAFDADDLFAYRDAKSTELNSSKSVLNLRNWTLTQNGRDVTNDYIYDIVYGYNASVYVEDYVRNLEAETGEKYYVSSSSVATNTYELVIVFKQELADGAYVLTLADSVADLASNKLDGDYSGESGGSFTVRFNVGLASHNQQNPIQAPDVEAFAGEIDSAGKPVVASNKNGFVIVTESQVLYEISGSSTNNNNNNNNNNSDNTDEGGPYGYYETTVIDGVTYRIESDIVMRHYNADGTENGVVTRVNQYAAGNQIQPDVAMTENGSYVVAWVGESANALNGVCARFYGGGKENQIQIAGRKGIRCWDVDVQINEETGLVLISWLQGSTTNEGADQVCGVYYDIYGVKRSEVFTIAENADRSVESFDVQGVRIHNKLHYVVVWSAGDKSTLTSEIYQRSFVASYVAGEYVVEYGQTTRVNETTTNGPYTPQIAMVDSGDDVGKYYVVWVSDQTQSNGADIYARAYHVDGGSLSFLGTTGEALVNTTTAHRQYLPSVDANSDGLIVAWASYDVEEYNYSQEDRVDQHDDGIAVRVFNSEGLPVNVANDKLSRGEVVGMNEGEFVINSTTAGYQSVPSVSMFDWEETATALAPKFVVAWQGPNPKAGEPIENLTNTVGGSTNN
ncbi:MAG: trypsin-like serine protease, partial [Thermoguttaceae bacterium]|nr:trypsin-like serine protease [Thermoguttaceae bacterium]